MFGNKKCPNCGTRVPLWRLYIGGVWHKGMGYFWLWASWHCANCREKIGLDWARQIILAMALIPLFVAATIITHITDIAEIVNVALVFCIIIWGATQSIELRE